jgi:hypothetical protein
LNILNNGLSSFFNFYLPYDATLINLYYGKIITFVFI